MRATLSFLIVLSLATFSSGQTVRMTTLSSIYDVEVIPGECGGDQKCGPVNIVLWRKGARRQFQTLSAGRLAKSDIATSVQFVDLNFDGIRDLAVFDGLKIPGGYGTEAQRIYLYSKTSKRFVFNRALSAISNQESLAVDEPDKTKRLIYAHARRGGGVFQARGYRFMKNDPVLMYEVISDATFKDGTLTKVTTRKLIEGRWRTWTKAHKGLLNR